jgi:hypothetical protein
MFESQRLKIPHPLKTMIVNVTIIPRKAGWNWSESADPHVVHVHPLAIGVYG